MKKPKKIKDTDNLVGKQFGRRVVVAKCKCNADSGQRYWIAVCECGTICKVTSHGLLISESCGCKHREHMSEVMKVRGKYTMSYEQRVETAKKCNAKTIVDGCKISCINGKLFKNNTSGYKGVCFKHGKWEASIGYKKKRYHLLRSSNIEDCIKIREEAVAAINGNYFEEFIQTIK